jgi:hypothetical protein
LRYCLASSGCIVRRHGLAISPRLSRVIASEAKQSISPRKERVDCFVASLLAMTTNIRPRPRGAMRPSFTLNVPSSEIRGRRECRAPNAPAASRAKLSEAHERSHHGHTGNRPAFPHAMVLRLISCSPRRRIRLATVIRGLEVCPNPVGPTSLRELDTSNGCQNDTSSPSAALRLSQRLRRAKHRSSACHSSAHGPCRPALPSPDIA